MNFPTAKEIKEKSIIGAALQKQKFLQELFVKIEDTAHSGGEYVQYSFKLDNDTVNLLESLGYKVIYLPLLYGEYTTIRW